MEARNTIKLSKSDQVRMDVEVLIAKGVLVKQVANVLGVYYQDVVKIRKGERVLPDDTADRYLERLNNAGKYIDVEVEKKDSTFESLVKEIVRQELENLVKKTPKNS